MFASETIKWKLYLMNDIIYNYIDSYYSFFGFSYLQNFLHDTYTLVICVTESSFNKQFHNYIQTILHNAVNAVPTYRT